MSSIKVRINVLFFTDNDRHRGLRVVYRKHIALQLELRFEDADKKQNQKIMPEEGTETIAPASAPTFINDIFAFGTRVLRAQGGLCRRVNARLAFCQQARDLCVRVNMNAANSL